MKTDAQVARRARGGVRLPWIVLVLVALALAAAARAEDGAARGAPTELDQLVSEALANNPEVAAAREALTAARSRIPQARALSDPMLALNYVNDGWSPSLGQEQMTTLGIMASQGLPFPGKRGLRGEIAGREADQVEQQLARVRLRVAADVKRAYYGLLLARELGTLVREQQAAWREIEGVVRNRYAVGEGAQQDVLRVQVEQTRVEQSALDQDTEAEIRLAELNRLLARPLDTPLATATTLTLTPLDKPLSEVFDQARAVSPELASARAGAQAAQLSLALARKEYKPDFSIQAGYMNRGGLAPMWQAGIGVTLPVRRARRAAAVAQARAADAGSGQAVRAVELALRYRTQERYARLKSTEKIIALYDTGIVPQDRMSVEAALANYQTGKVPFVTVLEAQTALYGDRWTLARLTADHERLRTGLEEESLGAEADLGGAAMPATGLGGASLGMSEGSEGR